MGCGTRIRVFVADDHPVYRTGLRREFESDPDLTFVGAADNGNKALEDIIRLRPDVAVLDISMPGKNGLQVLSAVRDAGLDSQSLRIVLLTGTESSDVIYSAVAQGVGAYLVKTMDWHDLAEAIKRVHAGETIIAPEALTILSHQVQAHSQREQAATLTSREIEVLALAAEGLTRDEIADRLSVSPGTIKSHLRNTFAKLEVRSSAAAVAEAIRQRIIK